MIVVNLQCEIPASTDIAGRMIGKELLSILLRHKPLLDDLPDAERPRTVIVP